jgi:HK97 family phage major capsid protein
MSCAEARSEIKKAFEQADLIEKKYEGPITDADDEREVKRLLGEIDGLEAKLASLEETETRRNRILAGMDRYNKPARAGSVPNPEVERIAEGKRVDPGTQFIQSREYRELKLNGTFQMAIARPTFAVTMKEGTSLLEWKALLRGGSESSGGGFVVNDHRPGFLDLKQRSVQVLDLIPRVTTESDTIEYVKEDTFTNAAAFTAEATATGSTSGSKPESTLAYSVATSPVKSLAHWIPVTNRMLNDAPMIRGIINTRLLMGLDLSLETQVVTGDGNGENLTGFTVATGVQIQGLGSDTVLDCLWKARQLVRVTGRGNPEAYLVHPNDWTGVRLARENAATATLGNYLMGPPTLQGPVTVWGIPVVESDVITENTALVGDFGQGCTLFDREQAAIRVGTVNDQFIRNMLTILAELRLAFVVWRPAMFCKVTGV